MIARFKELWPYLLIAVISATVVLIWYQEPGLLYFADSTYPIGRPVDYIKSFSSAWNENYSGGIVNSTGFAILPLFIFIALLELVGFSQVVAQAIFFSLILFITGSGVIALLRYLDYRYDAKGSSLAFIAPAVFYMFNLYIAVNGWRMLIFLYLFYAFLPILVLQFLKYLETENLKYIIYFSILTSLVVVVALTNFVFLMMLIALLASLSFLEYRNKGIIKLSILYLKAFCVWLPLNIWYILPQITTVADSAAKATGGGDLAGSLSILNVISSHASFLNILTLRGYYALHDTIAGNWFSWSPLFNESLFSLLSFIFPVLFVVVLIVRKGKSKIDQLILFALLLIVFATFFAKGSHPPFENVFLYLFDRFPVPFLAFRAAYEKLGIFIVFAYLLVIFLFYVRVLPCFKHFQKLIGASVLLVIVILGFPVWSGRIFDSDNGIRTSAHVIIPDDYYKVAEILKEDPHALALSLPLQFHTWSSSKWSHGRAGYLGNDILRLLSQTPIISTDVGNKKLDEFNRTIERDFGANNVDVSALRARNVKYLIVRKDINYEWAAAYGKQMIKIPELVLSIEGSKKFHKRMETDNLILYELVDANLNEHIYASEKLYSTVPEIDIKSLDAFASASYGRPYIFSSSDLVGIPSQRVLPLFSVVEKEDVLNEVSKIKEMSSLQEASDFAEIYDFIPLLGYDIWAQDSKISVSADYGDRVSLFSNGAKINFGPVKKQQEIFSQKSDQLYFFQNGNLFIPIEEGRKLKTQDKGNSKIVVSDKANIVDNGSFESGLWNDQVMDCSRYDEEADIAMSLLEKGLDDKYLQLYARNHIACTSQKLNLKQAGRFLVSFDYRSVAGSKVGFALDYVGASSSPVSGYSEVGDQDWHNYSQVVSLPEGITQPSIYLYAFPRKDVNNPIVQYDNVRIHNISGEYPVEFAQSFVSAKLEADSSSSTDIVYVGKKSDFRNDFIIGWQYPVHDCGSTTKAQLIDMELTNDRGAGSSIKLSSGGHIACTFSKIELSKGQDYILNFDYRADNNDAAGYYLGFNDAKSSVISKKLKSTGAEWKTETIDFSVPGNAVLAYLYFYAYESEKNPMSIASYSKIELSTFPSVKGRFVYLDGPEPEIAKPGNLTYELINPTKKIVHINSAQKPFYLVMSSSYSDSWKALFANEEIGGHFEVNGFSNGWFVNPFELCSGDNGVIDSKCRKNDNGTYDFDLKIEFEPQKWFYIGLTISSLSFICLLLVSFYLRKKHSVKDAASNQ